MNKKADSRLLTPYLFIILGIIGLCIVIAIWMFYSIGIDIKVEEAKSMNNNLLGAVVEGDYFNKEVLNKDFNILEKAGIDEKVINSGNYYFSLKIYENNNEIKNFTYGVKDFGIQCKLPGEQMAKCYEKRLRALDKQGREYEIKILTGSNQLGSKL